LGAHGKIFISYRREDAPGDARGICDRLRRSFGEANVFMDVDQLLAGQRFDRELDKALAKSDVLIAVIGSRWMDLLSEYAQRGTRDYVRDEISAALMRDIIVIPVMMGREANMPPLPAAKDLPENIRDLVLYQKHNIAHESFGRDAAHLIAALKTLLRERRAPRPWRAIAAAAVIGLALTGALLGYWMDLIPPIGTVVAQRRNLVAPIGTGVPQPSDGTITALSSSDLLSKKPEDEAKQKIETDAKADEKVVGTKAATDSENATKKAMDNAVAMGNLGLLYANGRGVAQDYAEARKWYEQAAGLGYSDAMFNLGVLYEQGHGVTQDFAEARKWYEKAAALGNAAAMTNLGLLYQNGRGVAQDSAEARKWYEQADKTRLKILK
jgi:TIR domain/Sel1 repeat